MHVDDLPGKDKLIEALRLIGRTPDGRSLPPERIEEIGRLQIAQIVGALDAAVEELAQSFSRGVGKGKSQRHLVLNGVEHYQRASGYHRVGVLSFIQKRLERLAHDMPVQERRFS